MKKIQIIATMLKFFLLVNIGLCALGLLLIVALAKENNQPNFLSYDSYSKELGIFGVYQNKIYAEVADKGVYYIPEADAASFQLIADAPLVQHIGTDQSHVYCGNLILPNLNPATVYFIGDNYLSDGKLTYYCSPNATPNQQLGATKEIYQQILFNFSQGPKPQVLLYSFKLLPMTKESYQLILANIVSDGQQAYLFGNLLPLALPQNLHYLSQFNGRASNRYLTDKQHVYYENKLLNIRDNGQLVTYDISSLAGHYLEDPVQHYFYFQDIPFPAELKPLRILNTSDKHGITTLFVSSKGIYYVNRDKNIIKRAGDSPFNNVFEQIYPDIYSNGINSFFLMADETHTQTKAGSFLCGYVTYLMELVDAPAKDWEEMGNTGHGLKSPGSIWRNGNRYFYFDKTGQNDHLNSAIYEIRDPELASYMLFDFIEASTIHMYIKEGLMHIPKHRVIIQADNRFNGCWSSMSNIKEDLLD